MEATVRTSKGTAGLRESAVAAAFARLETSRSKPASKIGSLISYGARSARRSEAVASAALLEELTADSLPGGRGRPRTVGTDGGLLELSALNELKTIGRRRGGGPPIKRFFADNCDMPAAGPPMERDKRGVRQFDNSPLQQSVVDQVVFGRDIDNSGDTQFDQRFIEKVFGGCAGRASWESAMAGKQLWDEPRVPGMQDLPELRAGRRTFQNVPTQQSVVDQVVYGRDIDASGDSQFDGEYVNKYEGSAGRPSWKAPQSGKLFGFAAPGKTVYGPEGKLLPLSKASRRRAQNAKPSAGSVPVHQAPIPPSDEPTAMTWGAVLGDSAPARGTAVQAGRGPMSSLMSRWSSRTKGARGTSAAAVELMSEMPNGFLSSVLPSRSKAGVL